MLKTKTTLLMAALALFMAVNLDAAQKESDLQQIADALDVSTTKTFQFTANGSMYSLGQNTSPAAAWPRQFVKSMTRTYDFTTGAMRDEIVRMSAETVTAGPEQRVVQLVSGGNAWNEAGKDTVPRLFEANDRAHQIVISPHGLVRAAFANNAAVTKKTIEGRPMTVISFTDQGNRVTAYANEQYAIELVESAYGNPVVGDIKVVTYYGPYRDFAGVKFPTKMIQYHDGKPTLDVTVTAVRANPSIDIQVPAHVQNDPVPVKSEKVADGLWYITGVSAYSVLVEMKDYLIVIEAPHGERRAMAVMDEVKKLVPNKPIKYLVNTHHHFDHSSGVRAFAAEGVTIVTHEVNRPLYERAALNTWTLAPDRLAKSKKKPVIQAMGDNMVLTDGARSVELYQITNNTHHDGIIMAYLRKERILIEADAFSPGPAGAEPPKVPNPFTVALDTNIRRLNLDVDKIVPIHGRIVSYSDLLADIGKKPAPAAK